MTANVNAMLDVVIEESVARASRHLGPARVSFLSALENEGEQGSPPAGESALAGLRSRLIRLRGSAQRLVSAEPGSAFAEPQMPQVVSSRRPAVEAEGVAGTSRGRPAVFHVQVTAVARAQVNQGAALDASALAGIHPGINTFTISLAGGGARTITVNGDAAETNAEALARLADAINARAGVVARVVADDEAGTVRLDLAATETGTPHAFTVADITGNVVGATGIAAVSATAADARLVIDGVARASASNTLLIDGGRVRLVLKAVTGPGQSGDEVGALISVAPDPVSRATTSLADAVNDLREFVAIEGSRAALTMLDMPNLSNLGRAIDVLLESRAQELETLGLTVGPRIAVDVERLAREIEGSRDRVEVVLGAGEGLAAKLSVLAEEGLGASLARALHTGRGGGPILGRHALISPASRGRGFLIDIVG